MHLGAWLQVYPRTCSLALRESGVRMVLILGWTRGYSGKAPGVHVPGRASQAALPRRVEEDRFRIHAPRFEIPDLREMHACAWPCSFSFNADSRAVDRQVQDLLRQL
eukprot:670896-Rhodomonas_salina.6